MRLRADLRGRPPAGAIPIEDWERDAPRARLDWEHPLLKAMDRFYDQLLERARGTFIVGLTDFHPGGDHLAALRDPANLAMDMIDHPDEIETLLAVSQQGISTCTIISMTGSRPRACPAPPGCPCWTIRGRYYIPSNDFSCMISKAMYDEVFLPGIQQECRFITTASTIWTGRARCGIWTRCWRFPSWTPSSGSAARATRATKWVPVYQRIQAAGKGLALYASVDELPMIFETLRPEGRVLRRHRRRG